MNDNAKKQVPLRLSPKLYAAIAAWAEDDFRSVNGQIEYTFHDILGHSGNDNRVFHRPAFPQQYGGFFQENGSRYKMVLDWVQRYLGRIFDLKLLLGRLRLDA